MINTNLQQQENNMTHTQTSIVEQLKDVVKKKKDNIFVTWHEADGSVGSEYTFGELWEAAGLISHKLRNEWGVKKGEKVVLCYGTGLHFFGVFLGCIRAGVVAVLVYPPTPPLAKSLAKMTKVISDCNPTLILTDTQIYAFKKLDEITPFSKSRDMWPQGVEYKVTDLWKKSFWGKTSTKCFDEPCIGLNDVAFYQYTVSGL